MATFPKLFRIQSPWHTKQGLFMSESGPEAPEPRSSGEAKEAEKTAEEILAEEKKKLDELTKDISFGFLNNLDSNATTKVVTKKNINEVMIPGTKFEIDFGIGKSYVDQPSAKGAERVTRLDMMVPSDVRKIELTSKKYGETVTLVRSSDGRFRKENQSTKEHHYYVFQGDQFSIKERGNASSQTSTSTPKELPATVTEAIQDRKADSSEALRKSATERQVAHLQEKATLESSFVEVAIGGREYDAEGNLIKEEYGQLGDGVSRTLDESLIGWTMEDFDLNWNRMEYGMDVKNSLERMARAGNKSSGLELWKDIYKGENKDKPDEIYFSEVAKSAMGKDAMNLRLEYLNLTDPDGDIAYLKKELVEEKEKKSSGETDEKRAERYDKRIKRLEAKKATETDPDKQKKIQARIDDLKDAKANDREARLQSRLAEAEARKAQLEEFYKGAVVFMASIEHLSLKGEKVSRSTSESRDNSEVEGLEDLGTICSILFDKNNEGPVVKPTFWEKLFKKESEHVVSMDLNEGQGEAGDFFQARVSEKGAWVMLEQMGITHNEKGDVVVDKNAFLRSVNELLILGIPYLSVEPDWSAEAKRYIPEKAQFATWEDMMTALTKNPDVVGHSDEEYQRRFNHDAKSTYREAIRYGMGAKMGLEMAKNRRDEAQYQEALRRLNVPTPTSVEQRTMERVLATAGELTPEQRAEVANNIHQHYLGTLSILRRNVEGGQGSTGLGLDLQTQLCKEPSIVLHAGLNGNVYSEQIEAHVGVDLTAVKTNRFELHFVGGANGTVDNVNLGVGAQTSVGLGEYQTYKINLGAGTTLTPLALAMALNLGVDRDLAQVLVKKTDALIAENTTEFDKQMALTKEVLGSTMSPEDIKEMEAQMQTLFIQEMGDQATENLKTFQFLGAGVTYITPMPPLLPLGLALPYVKLGIKGKEYTLYKKSTVDIDSVLQQRINEQVAKQTSSNRVIEVSEGGSTLLDRNGERVLGQVQVEQVNQKESIADANNILAEQYLNLEPVTLTNGTPALRLKVGKVDGTVNIFVDPKSGIKVVEENGQIYVIANPSNTLHFTRTDEYTGFQSGGEYHNVGIYIGDNPHLPFKTIQESSNNHLTYQADLAGNIEPDTTQVVTDRAEIAQDQTRDGPKVYASYTEQKNSDGRIDYGSVAEDPTKTAVYDTLEEMMASGIDLGSEDPKTKQARDRLSRVMEAEARSADLNPARKAEIEAHAKELMASQDTRLSYKALSLEGNHTAVAQMVKDKYPSEAWDPKSMTYMIQALMVESLSTATKEVVTEWNTTAITKILTSRMAPDQAERVAKDMVSYFNTHMGESSPISEGSILQVLVGTEGLEGYREANWTGSGNLKGAVDFPGGLTAMGLSSTEASIVNDIMVERMADLPKANPEEMLRSQIGLHVLKFAPDIFTPEVALKVADLKDAIFGSSIHDVNALPSELKSTYESVTTLIQYLRDHGHFENARISLSVKTEKKLGLFDKCQNFSTLMKETVTYAKKGGTVSTGGAETYDSLEGRQNADVYGSGVVGGITNEEAPPPPEEETPPPDEGSKNPPVLAGTDDRPLQGFNPGGGTDGDAGTAGADW